MPPENQDVYFYGAQSIILMGIQIIQIRSFLRQTKELPIELKKIIQSLLGKIRTQSLLINTQNINDEYKQLLDYVSTIDETSLLQKILPLLSAVCIIKSQLPFYEKFMKCIFKPHQNYI